MFDAIHKLRYTRTARLLRSAWVFTFTLLAVEFLDELVFGVKGAVLPAIRTGLGLTYEQIGVLLSVPHFAGSAIEPALGILGDDYPGTFSVEDTQGLADLMLRAENDADFYRSLEKTCRARAWMTDPAQEQESWRELLHEIMSETADARSS